MNSESFDLYKQGEKHLHAGRKDEAVALFRKAVQLDPAFAEAYNRLGLTLADLHHFEDAIVSLEKAIQVNDQPSWVYFGNLAETCFQSGYFAKAAVAFEECIELYHEQETQFDHDETGAVWRVPDDHLRNLYKRLQLSYEGCGASRMAQKALIVASQIVEEDIATVRRQAEGFRRRGELDITITLLEEALSLRPFDTVIHFDLGRAHCDNSDIVSARRQYEILLNCDAEKAVDLLRYIDGSASKGM